MAIEVGTPFTTTTLGGFNTTTGTTQGTSTATNLAQSSSGPVATPQSELSLLLSQAAQQAGLGVLNWARSALGPDQAVTNAAINHYFNTALTQEGLARTTAGQYYNQTMPEMVQQGNLAATYNSAPRQSFEAGRAEANAVQGGYAGIQNARQQLQAYGIRPDSGVYQELGTAAQAAIGAGAAAAGTQAAQGVQQTGINLLQNAIASGQQLPGQSVNSANAGTQAVSGASNAQLANTQTGAQAQAAAQPFLQTASNLTPEQIASQSSSYGTSSSQETGTSTGQGQSYNTIPQNIYNPGGSSTFNNVTGEKGGAIPMLAMGGGLQAKKMSARIPHVSMSIPHSGKVFGIAGMGGKGKRKGGSGGGKSHDPQDRLAGQGAPTNPGNTDPQNAFLNSDDALAGASGKGRHGGGGGRSRPPPPKNPQQDQQMDGAPPPGGIPTNGSTISPTPFDATQTAPTDVGQTATPPISSPDNNMAGGGAIPDHSATSGGHLDRSMSPSHGKQVDDIPAQLNAGEFVIPRDVTAYYGQKHFHNLINKARKETGAPNPPAKPSFAPHTPGPPHFVSQHMFAGGIPSAGIPAPGAPSGDSASRMSPAMQQWGSQYRHPDASAPW